MSHNLAMHPLLFEQVPKPSGLTVVASPASPTSAQALAQRHDADHLQSTIAGDSGNSTTRRSVKTRLLDITYLENDHILAQLDRVKQPYTVVGDGFTTRVDPGFGGTVLLSFESPKFGRKVWILEVTGVFGVASYWTMQFHFEALPSEEDCGFLYRTAIKSRQERIVTGRAETCRASGA